MQALSLQAIFLFHGVFLFSCVLWTVWLFRSHADLSARLWIVATLLSAVSTSVTAWRAELPFWLGFQLPNAIQLAHSLLVALAVQALLGPVPRLRMALYWVALVVASYAAGLALLAQHFSEALVTAVSLANGLTRIVPAVILRPRFASRSDAAPIRWLLWILTGIGVLWLLRIPVFFLGQGDHAMDPKTMNWLIFASMLGMGIALQFAYMGVRFTQAYEYRLAFSRTRTRLAQVLSERDALQRLQHAPSGALASQMAHEINQPLAAIRLSLEAAACKPFPHLPQDELEALLHDIDRISHSLERANALTSGAAPEVRSVSGATLLSHLTLAARVAGVPVSRAVSAPDLRVRCDPGPIATAWMTMLKRVVSAGDGVTLSLELASATRVQLAVEAPASGLKSLPQALRADPMPQASSVEMADTWLDLLTLEHLARAHAGQFAVKLSDQPPRRLQMTLLLPAEPSGEQAPNVEAMQIC